MRVALARIGCLAALGLATGACSGNAPMAGSDPSTVSQGSVTPVGPADENSAETAYAESLLRKVVVPAAATRVSHAPLPRLGEPFEQTSFDRPPTVVSWFWTIDEPMSVTYAWVSQHAPSGASMGGGAVRGANGITLMSLDRTQGSRLLPPNMTYGDIFISVAPLGDGSAAIAAYATTRAQPTRPADSRPRAQGSTVSLGWWASTHGPHRSRTLTGSDAATFVTAYDAMTVSTSGMHSCPANIGHDDVTVTISSGGHRWYSDLTTCWPIGIARDGHPLAAVDETADFRAQLEQWSGRQPGDNTSTWWERQKRRADASAFSGGAPPSRLGL